MDPKTCIDLINDAIAASDVETIADGCEDLLTWIRRGGACQIYGKPSHYWDQWATALRKMAIAYALAGESLAR